MTTDTDAAGTNSAGSTGTGSSPGNPAGPRRQRLPAVPLRRPVRA